VIATWRTILTGVALLYTLVVLCIGAVPLVVLWALAGFPVDVDFKPKPKRKPQTLFGIPPLTEEEIDNLLKSQGGN